MSQQENNGWKFQILAPVDSLFSCVCLGEVSDTLSGLTAFVVVLIPEVGWQYVCVCLPWQQTWWHWKLADWDLSSFYLSNQKGSSIYVSIVICNACSGSLCFSTYQKSQQIVQRSKPGASVKIYKDTHSCCCCVLSLTSSFFSFDFC